MPGDQNSVIQLVIVGTVLLLLVGGFVVSFLLIYTRKQKKHQLEKLAMHNSFQQELLKTQLEIQEQTLHHISQEIHDNIGQSLSLAKLNLNTLDGDAESNREEKLRSTRDLVSKVIADLRQLSKTMNTEKIMAAGLVNALEQELAQLRRSGLFETSLRIEGQAVKLPPQKELILFRIVQESLNNIIKHAGAHAISIVANYETSQLVLMIKDDGRGFDPSEARDDMESGSGLRNMKSRASLIGGTLDISSNGYGTLVTITTPTIE